MRAGRYAASPPAPVPAVAPATHRAHDQGLSPGASCRCPTADGPGAGASSAVGGHLGPPPRCMHQARCRAWTPRAPSRPGVGTSSAMGGTLAACTKPAAGHGTRPAMGVGGTYPPQVDAQSQLQGMDPPKAPAKLGVGTSAAKGGGWACTEPGAGPRPPPRSRPPAPPRCDTRCPRRTQPSPRLQSPPRPHVQPRRAGPAGARSSRGGRGAAPPGPRDYNSQGAPRAQRGAGSLRAARHAPAAAPSAGGRAAPPRQQCDELCPCSAAIRGPWGAAGAPGRRPSASQGAWRCLGRTSPAPNGGAGSRSLAAMLPGAGDGLPEPASPQQRPSGAPEGRRPHTCPTCLACEPPRPQAQSAPAQPCPPLAGGKQKAGETPLPCSRRAAWPRTPLARGHRAGAGPAAFPAIGFPVMAFYSASFHGLSWMPAPTSLPPLSCPK